MKFSFDARAGLIRVSCRVWGPKRDVVVLLALDTGATSSLISRDWLRLAGYDPAKAAEREAIITGSGGGGDAAT